MNLSFITLGSLERFWPIDLGDLATGGRMQQAPGGALAGHNFVSLETETRFYWMTLIVLGIYLERRNQARVLGRLQSGASHRSSRCPRR